MSAETERVDLETLDLAAARRAAFEELFPGVLADGVVDATRLGELLDTEVTAPTDGRERFGLMWAGKHEAVRSLLTPSRGTLVPELDRSIDFDTAKHVFIEGDNLDVLKLLQKAYNDRVKLIYIDPPYNTGSGDFIYPDNFADTTRAYLEYTGQVDAAGTRTSASADTAGRLHSRWLSMMYPRLMLARNLLTQDGVLAVSIDDNELSRLVLLGSEIFGEQNLLNVICVKSSEASGVKMAHVERRLPKMKEYIVVFARDKDEVSLQPVRVTKDARNDGKLDGYLRYYGKVIVNPDAPVAEWRIEKISDYLAEQNMAADATAVKEFQLSHPERVVYRTNNKALAKLSFDTPTAEVTSSTGLRYIWWEGKQMLFLSDHLAEVVGDLWSDVSTINLNKETLGVTGFGEGQKPLALVGRLIRMFTGNGTDEITMDFFAGSGTTAHAVLAQNAKDGGNRRFIAVQLPEPTGYDDYEFVSDVTRARIAAAIEEVGEQGVRSYRLAGSSFRGDVGVEPTELFDLSESTLRAHDQDAEAIAAEVLLKEGVPLDARWKESVAGGVRVIEAAAVAVVLSLQITERVVADALALGARVVVFLEDGFAGADAVKANAVTNARNLGITLKTV